MAQTVTVSVEIPRELIRQLDGEIAALDKSEQTRLQSAPYNHDKRSQWLLENAVCSRRNVPETVGTEVEIDERGRVEVVESSGLLG